MIEKARVRRQRINTESSEISDWLKRTLADGISTWWLPTITAVGLAVRAYFLAEPMRYDEAYTFLNFMSGPWYGAFDYPLPNNHVLHTILGRASVMVFGSHPVAMRLPAFLAGVCVIPASYFLAYLVVGKRSGVLTSALVAVFPYLILYDTMARGYSLLVLLSIFLAILGFRFGRRPSMALCWWMSLTVACGLLTMPSFLFPAAGIFAWVLISLLIERRTLQWITMRFLMPCSVMSLMLTGLFYAPVCIVNRGIHIVVGNRFVEGLPWPEFAQRLPGHGLHTVTQFARGIPLPLLIAGLGLSVIGLCVLVWTRRWNSLALMASLVLGGAVVLVAKHAIPYARTWIYVLPFAFLLVDVGFVKTTRLSANRIKPIVLLFSVASGVLLMNHNVVASFPDTGHFREAPIVADFLSTQMNRGDQVVAETPANWPLYFYLWYKDVPRGQSHSHVRRRFFVVHTGRYSLSDLTEHDPQRILDIPGARVYALEIDD